MFCNNFFPLRADIYYATQDQNNFGEIDKAWEYNQTINIDFNLSTNYKDQQMQADQMLWVQDLLGGRSLVDIRKDDNQELHSLTDIIITNVRNSKDEVIYFESAGPREGLPTIFEIAGVLPHNDPWGNNDYYKIVVKRSMIQVLED